MFVTIITIACIRGELQYHIQLGEGLQIFGLTILGIILLFLAALLFQFLYQQNYVKKSVGGKATSYVFVLDDSGSMRQDYPGSDPEGRRLEAVENLTSKVSPEFPYAVYRFNSDVEMIREFKPAREGMGDISLNPGGQTYMYDALCRVLDDYDAGIWHDTKSPRVILLADGQESANISNSSFREMMQGYADRGITISTVFLTTINEPIPDNMVVLADKTGGTYLTINNTDELGTGMAKAVGESAVTRDLLGRREIMDRGWIYAILRILFFTLLAIGAKSIMALVNQRGEDVVLILVFSVVAGIFAGIMIEIGINTLMLPDALMRAVSCMLIATVPATYTKEFQEIIRASRRSRLGGEELQQEEPVIGRVNRIGSRNTGEDTTQTGESGGKKPQPDAGNKFQNRTKPSRLDGSSRIDRRR